MPVIKPDEYELSEDQRADPLVWVEDRLAQIGVNDLRLPLAPTPVLELAFGAGTSRKLKSWGHLGDAGVHWLATRGGTAMHTDPAYARYTHHLILRNDGFRLRGLEDAEHVALRPGIMYCLDAHSPHQVVPDRRLNFLGKPIYKVQAAVDTDEPLDPDECWALIAPTLARTLEEGAAEAAKTQPAPRTW